MEHTLLLIFLWLCSGAFLTFMDRVDEHDLIVWKLKTPVAYIFAWFTAITFIFSIHTFPFLYPLLFWMCFEWILKNKLEYPSHVFFLFLTTLYFWYRWDLFLDFWKYIILYLLLVFFIWDFLKSKINKNSKFYWYFYKSYISKIFIDFIFAFSLFQPILLVFALTFGYSCLWVKKFFPGRNP